MKKPSWPSSAMTKTVLLVALALFAAACGDDSTETASGAATDEAAMTDEAMTDEAVADEAMADGMEDEMDHDDGHGDGHDGDHGGPIDVPDGMVVPTISITAEPDSKSGANLFVDLADFTIAPESASTDPVDGEGHLHLYVDGERTARFYNTELHVGDLAPGDHELMVEVSANNHSAYAVDGDPIRAMTKVTIPSDGSAGDHAHGGELFESANPPELEISVTKDPKSGYNLFADVTNVALGAENVGGEAVDGEGHLHVYVNDDKVGRLYGPWSHLKLKPGSNEIRVEVNGNDHVAYGSGGSAIAASTTVEVMDDGAMDDDAMDDEAMADSEMDDGEMDEGGHSHGHGGTGETLDIAAADADVVISGTLEGGDLTIDDRRYQVTSGQTVGVTFTSDETDQVHIHGYDILADVGPDQTVDVAFLADNPGTFEVEIEGSGRFLFEIQVR